MLNRTVTGIALFFFSLSGALAVATDARAEILNVGAEGGAAFPLGMTSEEGEAVLAVQAVVTRTIWRGFVAGALVGRAMQEFHTDDADADLKMTYFGLRLQYLFGTEEWETRPFAGIDLAYTRLRLTGDNASFAPPDGKETSGGLIATPEAGIWSYLPRINSALRFCLRLQRVRTNELIALGQDRTHTITGLGVGFGYYYLF